MRKKTIFYSVLLLVLCSVLSCGCGSGGDSKAADNRPAAPTRAPPRKARGIMASVASLNFVDI